MVLLEEARALAAATPGGSDSQSGSRPTSRGLAFRADRDIPGWASHPTSRGRTSGSRPASRCSFVSCDELETDRRRRMLVKLSYAEIMQRSSSEQWEWGIAKLGRAVRGRKAARAFLEVVEAAREAFFDERALRAGAKDNKFYKDGALMIRKQLADEPEVKEALDDAWSGICSGLGRPTTSKSISKQDYVTIMRKLYLAVHAEVRDRKRLPAPAPATH
jgi:hypothetical protein